MNRLLCVAARVVNSAVYFLFYVSGIKTMMFIDIGTNLWKHCDGTLCITTEGDHVLPDGVR